MGYKGNNINQPIIQINALFNLMIEKHIATENQKVFTLTNNYEQNANRIKVYVSGVPQYSPDNYTETSTNSITLSDGVPVGTVVIVEITK